MSNHTVSFEEDAIEQIAVIGLSGRFPGAKNIEKFWQNVRNGVDSISRFTDQELESLGIDPAVLSNPNYVRAKGELEDIELFDALFFGFSPREAEIMDPQHRIFLESAWEALENAGYDPATYPDPIGVFAGASMNDYVFNVYSKEETSDTADIYQKMIGNEKDFLTTRVSHKLNLKGPSLNVQTGCSTSLVAVQLACQSLLNYQCSMALAGGVCIIVRQRGGYFYQEGGIPSPDGYCRAFDAKAQGTVLSEGVGIVVLKRLSEALADGDTISAVIKGCATNNDGSMKVSFTAPSVDGQAEVIAMAQALSGVPVDTISYIEAHGTGTSLGDPIEIAALTQAFGASTHKKGFCAIGSVKTNVGHLDTAAGVTGLIKTVSALKHKEIPPSLHFEKPNPNIDFENSPFYVATKLSEWKVDGFPRRAGVSSFGIGGTNAHA
ncbi:MAG: polyketide synthase, partial [Proteobacteria bacterium]|nr:polyketide synthase [Pseudomonadota bacterium]